MAHKGYSGEGGYDRENSEHNFLKHRLDESADEKDQARINYRLAEMAKVGITKESIAQYLAEKKISEIEAKALEQCLKPLSLRKLGQESGGLRFEVIEKYYPLGFKKFEDEYKLARLREENAKRAEEEKRKRK